MCRFLKRTLIFFQLLLPCFFYHLMWIECYVALPFLSGNMTHSWNLLLSLSEMESRMKCCFPHFVFEMLVTFSSSKHRCILHIKKKKKKKDSVRLSCLWMPKNKVHLGLRTHKALSQKSLPTYVIFFCFLQNNCYLHFLDH